MLHWNGAEPEIPPPPAEFPIELPTEIPALPVEPLPGAIPEVPTSPDEVPPAAPPEIEGAHMGGARYQARYVAHAPSSPASLRRWSAQCFARAIAMRLAWSSGCPASSSAFAMRIAFSRTSGGRSFIDAG